MKVDYIKGYDPSNPKVSLLRLYEFSVAEVNDLMKIFTQLADKTIFEFELNEMPCISSIKRINLTLKVSNKDIGISQISEKSFISNLSPAGWLDAKELPQPFSEDNITKGYQWLYDLNSEIDFFLSKDGRW